MTDTLSPEQQSSTTNTSSSNVLKNRNFRMLWFGEGISLLGDQFYLIALPWLVLSLTGNALVVGTVMAMAGIPRALFMLVAAMIVLPALISWSGCRSGAPSSETAKR